MGLRANASAPMTLDDCAVPSRAQLTEDGAGFQAMLNVVLPLFNLGSAAVALGLCRAAVAATVTHLKNTRFEHLGQSLGESLPTLRAQLATMQIDTDGLAARIDDYVDHLEKPRETTLLRALECKAAAGDDGDRCDLDGDAGLRRCGLLAAYLHRATVPRRPCGRGDGADRRRPARVHRQGNPGLAALQAHRAGCWERPVVNEVS